MLQVLGGLGAIEVALRAWKGCPPASRGPAETLSTREQQIAMLVVEGLSNKEIGALLGTSANTVRKQVAQVYRKLGVRGRVELVRLLSIAP
jgi:DNA-binding NarL/FixJ family response regulator